MIPAVQLRTKLSDDTIAKWKGKRFGPEMLTLVADGDDVDIFKPSGEPLLMVRRGAVPSSLRESAFESFETAGRRYGSDNRSSYSGLQAFVREGSKTRRAFDENGKPASIQSAIIGMMDRQGGRHPYCRSTAFTAAEVEHWPVVTEAARFAAQVFESELASRFTVQKQAADACHPAWIIPGTPFSTITANRNVLGAVHKDAGDLPNGFGVITCHRRGHYRGGILGFVQYGVGVDLRDGDLILFDPHDWHGVTDMLDKSEDACRVTAVYYLRARMQQCGSPEEELKRARALRDQKAIER